MIPCVMRSDEKRMHRLNFLLRYYMRRPVDGELYERARRMGVSDSTARDYTRTVITRARRIRAR